MSNRMKAKLTGDDVTINNPGPIEQVITVDENTIWTWHVSSSVQGHHMLKANLYALVKVDGKEAPRIYDAGVVNVGVTVSPIGWAARHWEWIAGTIVIPAVTFLFTRKSDKKKTAEDVRPKPWKRNRG
jgi:hypothetical protein